MSIISLVAALAIAASTSEPAGVDADRAKFRPWSFENRIIRAAGPRLAPLALAIVQRESGFDPEAVSKTGCRGLFQLQRDTARELGVDREDPDQNIAGGAKLLNDGYAKYGTIEGAACYFAHPARCGQ